DARGQRIRAPHGRAAAAQRGRARRLRAHATRNDPHHRHLGLHGGVSMTQAKAALGMALDTLRASDRFNVLEFNSNMRTWLPAAVPATSDNIQRAREWVRKLRAGGGTNMAPALRFALDGTDRPGYLRQVVFITDGGVGNEDDL